MIEPVNLRQNDNIAPKDETKIKLETTVSVKFGSLVHYFYFTPFTEKAGLTRIGHFTVVCSVT